MIVQDHVYDHGQHTLSHQFTTTQHRIVICDNTPQQPGNWTPLDKIAKNGPFTAHNTLGIAGGTRVM
jgi:hypothetical protein